MSFFRSILVTGGAGFIGSNFVHYVHARHAGCKITVLDALTYAGNLENLAGLLEDKRLKFIKGSIADAPTVREAMTGCEAVFNFAAETHVDRSIQEAGTFIETDVLGTYTLLRAACDIGVEKFVQISTDEVYGSSSGEHFEETSPLKPGNPYSASKCGGDLMCQAFFNTFQAPVVITRSSNNFGPYQHVEKFIPLFITNTIEGKELPLYGDGKHERDWIYVEDNCAAVELVSTRGRSGEIYNIAAGESRPNIEVAETILELLGAPKSRIVFIEDRKGHDRAYLMDSTKTEALGWSRRYDFRGALENTVEWYRSNDTWWRHVKSGAFRKYYDKHYKEKLEKGKTRGI
ncbi:MAG: dTDP-glucose 4,6-dehydratase [Candidatus Latescibacterota bacterium]|nr:MAG: dTDP-glucose 4,6-dehydratase [Candidatus Latescibacterota bacterium]